MTYVNKRIRLFLDRGDIKPERRRSEARLKTYPSAIDIRAWCDIVEDRRQHILELIHKETAKCLGKVIPIDAIITALIAPKIADIKKLQSCLARLWKFVECANLSEADRKILFAMKEKMDPICVDKGDNEDEGDKRNDYSPRISNIEDIEKSSYECVAKERHEREQAEIDSLIKSVSEEGGTYKVTARGPAKIITRVKGVRPAFRVVESGSITTRAQGPIKITQKNENIPKKVSHQGSNKERYMGEPRQNQLKGQTINQTRQEQPLKQSHQEQPTKLSPERSRPPEKPYTQQSHQGKPEKRSLEQSRQGQPEKRSRKESPQESSQRKHETWSSERSRQGSPETRSLEPSRQDKHAKEYLEQSRQGKPIKQSSHQEQFQQQPRTTQPQLEPICQEKSQWQTKAGKPLTGPSKIEKDGQSPRTNFFSFEDSEDLGIQLQARDTLCNELQATLENIKNERDEFKQKFETTLEELEAVKKLNSGSPIIPTSCKEEIEALELEIKVMRSGNLSPEQEAEVIKKEVEVLKKYCMKLKSVEDENEKLKLERDTLKSQVVLSDSAGKEKHKSVKDNLNRQVAGITGDVDENRQIEKDDATDFTLDNNLTNIDELKGKSKNLEEITRERDMLANRVHRLEKELLQFRDLPEDIDVYRNRSKMLDSALEERDKMSRKIEQIKDMEDELNQLRKKSARVDELEEEVKLFNKNGKNIGTELKKTKSRCTCLEKELQNIKMERDSMRTRIEYMKKELELLRAKSTEGEIYKLERDKLQIRLNEMAHIQVQYENLILKCKCLENAAAEKEMYKKKCEELLTMECKGDMLRSQMETAKCVERERNALVKQVGDLESCICEQEEEIKKLVMQIDNLCHNKDDNQCRMKEALATMRAEIEKKDCLIAESEEKLTAVQAQLKSSIQGVSCETTCYKTRIEELERELAKSHVQIEALKKQLHKNTSSLKGIEKLTKSECENVAAMKYELDVANKENKRLREIANKMVAITGDEHVQNMLKQSQCAVKRVVEELGRQYKEWDNMKRNQKKGIYAQVNKQCPCVCKNMEAHHLSDSENEKLIEELEDIQREKEKLEHLVKQIQNDKGADGPQRELISLRIDNAKLQEQLEKEKKQRKDLEDKLKIVG